MTWVRALLALLQLIPLVEKWARDWSAKKRLDAKNRAVDDAISRVRDKTDGEQPEINGPS